MTNRPQHQFNNEYEIECVTINNKNVNVKFVGKHLQTEPKIAFKSSKVFKNFKIKLMN